MAGYIVPGTLRLLPRDKNKKWSMKVPVINTASLRLIGSEHFECKAQRKLKWAKIEESNPSIAV